MAKKKKFPRALTAFLCALTLVIGFSIGYLAMDGISEAAKLNLHESIFNFLEIAIENAPSIA